MSSSTSWPEPVGGAAAAVGTPDNLNYSADSPTLVTDILEGLCWAAAVLDIQSSWTGPLSILFELDNPFVQVIDNPFDWVLDSRFGWVPDNPFGRVPDSPFDRVGNLFVQVR